MQTGMDHLVIGAASLGQGVEYIRDCLGVDMPYGGMHRKMGTHNHLMRLGEEVFLEIIAVDPEMEPPDRPRWYGLDDAYIRRQIQRQPTLLTWVVHTGDIQSLKEKTKFPIGNIERFTRGDLSWYFGLPEDGRLLAGGMLPHVIQWLTERHPAANMADLGCRLECLEIRHPYASWLRSALEPIDAVNLVKISASPQNEAPCLVAHIQTPTGGKARLHGAISTTI